MIAVGIVGSLRHSDVMVIVTRSRGVTSRAVGEEIGQGHSRTALPCQSVRNRQGREIDAALSGPALSASARR